MREHHDPIPSTSTNEVDGAVVHGTVVQVGTLDGGVHLHPAPPAPHNPVPRQLPTTPTPFTGRTRELAFLDRSLLSEEGPPVVVSAIGGMGKTWLALSWANGVVDQFPDGQLFVDLRGFSSDRDPLPTGAAIRGFLDALGVDPTRLPVDPHAQAARYRSLVSGKRMLIVLDNASDTDQITPLLPRSPRCAVLITSRRHLPGLVSAHGARHLQLDVFTGTESHTLLTARLTAARVSAESTAVRALVANCRGLPLALGVVAGRADAQPHLPLSILADELGHAGLDAWDDTDPATSLPTTLSWSYRALTAEQRSVFALLGIAPGPDIGIHAAAALTGLPVHRARAVTRALIQTSLLGQDSTGRYRMHDLVRAYSADRAAEDLSADDRNAAVRRVLDFYLHTAHAGKLRLDPVLAPLSLAPATDGSSPRNLANRDDATAWFTAEHDALLAGQLLATSYGRDHVVWQLAWSMDTFHLGGGHIRDQLSAWEIGLAAAERVADPTAQALAHRLLGYACARVGRHDDALAHLHEALSLAEGLDDRHHLAHTHIALGRAWEQQHDDARAFDHATRALSIYHALDATVWEAEALNAVGWFAARLGRYREARDHCLAALRLRRGLDDRAGEATTLDSLGYIAQATGHHADAVEHYRLALDLFHDVDENYEAADTLDRLGHPLTDLGAVEEARRVWTEALRLYEAQKREADATRVRGRLALLDVPRPRHG